MCITVDTGNEMEVVDFDYQKIAEAIRTACEVFERILEPIRETMQNITEAISAIAVKISDVMQYYSEDMRIVAQNLARILTSWLTTTCHCVVCVFVSFDPKSPFRYAALICILVKSHSAAYLEHVCASRKGHLLRCQDRGSSDSVSDDDNNSTNTFTITFAAAA